MSQSNTPPLAQRTQPSWLARLLTLITGEQTAPRSASIVPQNSVSSRTLVLLIAIMTFLSCVTLGAVILIQQSAIGWSSEVGREVTIMIRPVEGADIDADIATASAVARAVPGVGTVRLIPESESLALLEPWLGSGVDLGALSVPRMLVVELSDPREADLDQLAAGIEPITGASLDTHSAWQQQLNAMAGTVVISGLFVLVLIITATALAIVFATRGTMASNRAIVDVLHFIGASNSFIASEFQGRFLSIGLRGALAGSAAAIVFFLVISLAASGYFPQSAGNQLSVLFGRFALGWTGLVALALVVPLIAGLTAVTSRLTVRQFLSQIS